MKIFMTGASAAIGLVLLRRLLAAARVECVYCGIHRTSIAISHPKIECVEIDLQDGSGLDRLPPGIDVVLHLAGLTHADNEADYSVINCEGTRRLAERARERGCQRFVYVSSRCATEGSGAYGESKLRAEKLLAGFDWDDLTIVRPSEVYGAESREGVDALLRLAAKWRIAPMFWGDARIEFSPVHVEDFAAVTAALVLEEASSSPRVVELCGPENLGGVRLGARIARLHHALPVPIWWPGLVAALKLLHGGGISRLVVADRIPRATCRKTSRAPGQGFAGVPLRRFPG